jgi:hypothetical protein
MMRVDLKSVGTKRTKDGRMCAEIVMNLGVKTENMFAVIGTVKNVVLNQRSATDAERATSKQK